MQARRTQSLPCPHVPCPASKHNDNLVQWALDRDGHLSHSGWWKHCAESCLSCLTHTLSKIQPIISLPDSSSRWSLTPAVIPTHYFFFCFSLSLLTRTQISFTVSDSPTVLAGSGPDWRGKGGMGQDWGDLPAETEKEQTAPLLCAATPASLILHMYTHTRTCYQVLTSSEGSGRQCNFLNTFPHSQCWIFVVVGILNGNRKKCNRSDSLEHSGFLKDSHMFYHVNLQLIKL